MTDWHSVDSGHRQLSNLGANHDMLSSYQLPPLGGTATGTLMSDKCYSDPIVTPH